MKRKTESASAKKDASTDKRRREVSQIGHRRSSWTAVRAASESVRNIVALGRGCRACRWLAALSRDMFALELASAPVTSSFSDRFGAGGGSGANGDEAASSIPPEFRSKYSTSFADYPQPLSDPVRTRIWGPPIVRGSAGKPFSLRVLFT